MCAVLSILLILVIVLLRCKNNSENKCVKKIFIVNISVLVLSLLSSLLQNGEDQKFSGLMNGCTVAVSIVLVYVFQICLMRFLSFYIKTPKNGSWRSIVSVVSYTGMASAVLYGAYSFLDNGLHSGSQEKYYYLLLPAAFVCLADVMFPALYFRVRQSGKYLMAVIISLIMLLSVVFNIIFRENIFLYTGMTVTAFNVFICHVYMNEKRKINREKHYLRQKEKMHVIEKKMAVSQLEPHFIFNTLNSIYFLCDIDTESARKAIKEFSDYLRGNIAGLSGDELISFEKELDYVKHYLSLQQICYDDDLIIEYRTNFTDFMIPPFSLQSLVENAVMHGVARKKGYGTIKISSELSDDNIVVTVTDDGTGFDPDEAVKAGKSHIGLSNTAYRLSVLCGASLTVKGEKDRGTKAEIVIPYKEKNKI